MWLMARHADLVVCHGALAEALLHRRFPACDGGPSSCRSETSTGHFLGRPRTDTRRRLGLPEDARVLLAPG